MATYQQVLCDLIAIPSLSGTETAVAGYILDSLRASKVDAERDGRGNIVAVVGDGDDVLHVNGHMDTVAPVATWTRDPFKPVIENGRIYGLGASDMKGGLAVMMDLARRVRPRVKVVFSFTVCEEGSGAGGGSNGVHTVLANWGGRWAITVESAAAASGLTLGVGTQGHTVAVVRVKGVAAHSSQPEKGRNAVEQAAAMITRITAMNAAYPAVPIIAEIKGRPSMAVTLVRGGVASNIIPDVCELTISRRLAPGETREDFEAELGRLSAGLDAETEVHGGDPAACTDVNGHLFSVACAAATQRLGAVHYSFTRGRTDLVLFAQRGMDVLNFGPGLMGQGHSADEYCRSADLDAAAGVLGDIVNAL